MSLSMSDSQTAAEDAARIDCVPAPSLAPSLSPAQLSKFRKEGFLVLPAAPPPKRARVLPVVPADPTPGGWCRLCSGVSTSQAFLPRPGIVPGTPVAETPPPETQEDTFLYRALFEAVADLEAGNAARVFDLGIDVPAVGGQLVFLLLARADIDHVASVSVLSELQRHGVCLLSPREGHMTITFVGAAEVYDGTEGVSHHGQVMYSLSRRRDWHYAPTPRPLL